MDNAVGDMTKIAGQKPVALQAESYRWFQDRRSAHQERMVTLRGVQM
jgi:ribosomal protein L5